MEELTKEAVKFIEERYVGFDLSEILPVLTSFLLDFATSDAVNNYHRKEITK